MDEAGLFGPESVTWRVNREGVLLAGGGRALILQVAHPLVAAGVAQHSEYRANPFGRLQRTLDVTTTIVFGTRNEAELASKRLWSRHGLVQGTSDEAGGRFAVGTPYHAHDPDLLMWVHATLVDTAICVYDRYVAPLSGADRAAYYEEQKLLGGQYGIPRAAMPANYEDFCAYLDRIVADELAVTDALREVVDSILDPTLPLAAKLAVQPLRPLVRLITVGLLPQRLRDELGLAWSQTQQRALDASASVRRLRPLIPVRAREFPAARRASRRLAALSS